MNLDAYHYKTNGSYLDYEFHSEGPKGRIKKVVRYTPRMLAADKIMRDLWFFEKSANLPIAGGSIYDNKFWKKMAFRKRY